MILFLIIALIFLINIQNVIMIWKIYKHEYNKNDLWIHGIMIIEMVILLFLLMRSTP